MVSSPVERPHGEEPTTRKKAETTTPVGPSEDGDPSRSLTAASRDPVGATPGFPTRDPARQCPLFHAAELWGIL